MRENEQASADPSSDGRPRVRARGRAIKKTEYVAPDRTAVETHISRSLKYRRLIMEFLLENEDTTWESRRELDGRAANFAGSSLQCAEKWVFQWTLVGAPWRLDTEAIGGPFVLRRVNDWTVEDVQRAIRRGNVRR
jgi:hypothetical protein